jgi:CHAT domain-containing protein
LLQLGTIEAELSDYTAAQVALDEAEKIYTSLDAMSWKAIVWLRRGRIALRQGDFATAFKFAQKAMVIFDSVGQRVNHATAILLQGQVSFALGDLSVAAAAGRFALDIAQRNHIPSLRYAAHLLLGQTYEKQSNTTRALHHYRAAAATTERQQRSLTITLRPGFLEDKAQAWHALIALCLRDAGVESAFELLERAKSQVLLGYLANQDSLHWARGDALSRNLAEELERLRAEHQWFLQRVHALPQAIDRPNQLESQQALDEIIARERRMRLITEQLYLYNEASGATSPVLAPSLGDVQGALANDELLVEYYNDGNHLYAFSLSAQSIQVHSLPVTLQDLDQLLAQLRLNLAAALQVGPQSPSTSSLVHNAQRILGRLFAGLLEPLALKPEKWRCLFIVPYGVLHFLPFHLLHDGSTYLFQNYEVVILPAAGLITHPAPRRAPGAVTLADTWDGRLPNTLAEADIVHSLFGGKLFVGPTADRHVFQEQPLQILHIAAHGQYRLDQPDLSYIQLADGQFYADDLFQHDLSYELVTLSACETGRATVSGGDELIGLGRGFLYSGAGALILSLWQVADISTLRLMELVYQALHDGQSKAAALRSAQQAILEESPGLHPAYWGGFQLIGSSHPLTSWAEPN